METKGYSDRSNGIRFLIVIGMYCFLGIYSGSAQQYSFLQYSVQEGLSQSQVRCLFQDDLGYIWAGTLGGVSRFDGREFVNYDRESGLLNNQVNAIAQCKDGRIVIGSIGGVSFISSSGVESIRLGKSEQDVAVNAFFEYSQGMLWIGSENGLYQWTDGIIQPLVISGIPNGVHINSFFPFADGSVGVVAKNGVYKVRSGVAQLYFAHTDPGVHLFDAEEGDDGYVWVATRKEGLIRVSPDGIASEAEGSEALPSSTITGIMRASDGTFWLSSRLGFAQVKGNSIQSFAEREGLPTADVRDVMQDREGNIWLATYGSGLLRFTGQLFGTYTKAEGLSSNAVMSITSDDKGGMWFSTFDRGVSRLNGDTITPVGLKEMLGSSRIWTSLTATDGTIWFGSSDGLFFYDGSAFRRYSESDLLPDRMVLSIAEDEDHSIYVGTAGGLAKIRNGALVDLTAIPGYPVTRVRGVMKDRSGHLWMATRDGVFRFNGERFDLFDTGDGIPELSVYCVEVDDRNRVWVGTQAGLAVLNGREFRQVNPGEGSGSRTVNFLKFSGNRMWVGTLNGIFVSEETAVDPTAWKWLHFGLEDGLKSLETNLNAVYEGLDGILWFGTPEGVIRLDPHYLTLHETPRPPGVHLVSVLLNLQSPDWLSMGFQMNPLTGLPLNPQLNHRFRHLTFYFNGISTTYPEDVRYQFMLEGFEDGWQPLTAASFATYSNLPYDDFIFWVRASGRSGVWSEPVSFSFSILPPFWLRWWFILLEAVAVTGLAGWFFRARQRTLNMKREKELSELQARMLSLEQESLNSSMNRHFIFNALNSIQYYINRQDRMAANRYLSDFARLIRKNLDSSQDNLTSLRDEIERLELYLKLEHMRFSDKFNYEIRVDPKLNLDQIKVPAMLMQSFLENSIWHGLLPKELPGHILVEIHQNGESIEFIITDDGIGIDHSLRSKSGTDNHISKGMQITGSRVELIRKMTGQNVELEGPYQLHDAKGQSSGTRVCIRIPVELEKHYAV